MKSSIVGVRIVVDGWMKVFLADVKSATGQLFTRHIEHHGDAVAVLPYDDERRVALVISQFRTPVEHVSPGADNIIEPIAGVNDDGDAEACARREAMEEAGVRLGTLEKIANCWSMLAVSTERLELYLAPYRAADRVASGGGLAHENENIDVHEMSLATLADHVRTASTVDMKLLALAQALQIRRPDLFAPEPA
jgi:nudix-type nucleoside diphosphatase (YffH/AdpP family)